MTSDENYSHPGAGSGAETGREELQEVAEHQDSAPVDEGPRRKRAWIRKPWPVVVWSLALVLVGVQVLLELRGNAAILWAVENLGQDREKIWGGELWRLLTCKCLQLNVNRQRILSMVAGPSSCLTSWHWCSSERPLSAGWDGRVFSSPISFSR